MLGEDEKMIREIFWVISCFKPTDFRASHDDYAPIMEAAINYFH